MQAQTNPTDELTPSRYQFFILGLWQDASDRLVWRFSLEDSRTAQRNGFANLAALDAFLAAWIEERTSGEQRSPTTTNLW